MRVIFVFDSLKETRVALSALDQIALTVMVADLHHWQGLLEHGAYDLFTIDIGVWEDLAGESLGESALGP